MQTKSPFPLFSILFPQVYSPLQAERQRDPGRQIYHLNSLRAFYQIIIVYIRIKARKVKAGVSINPATPVSSLEDIIADIDLVLVMSVNPGFGGQAFIDNTYKKLARLREMIELSGSKALIEVDGGVNDRNAAALFDAGADILVAGNYVFKSPDPKAAIDLLKGQG